MNTISSSTNYSVTNSTSKGLSGLASGMDTQSMVDSMLSGTQAKIDKQNASKQQLVWKQKMYRDIITNINNFQSKFFNNLSSGSMLLSSFYNAMSAASKSSAFNVTANSSAAAGKTNVQVAQLATKSSLKSAERVSGNLEGQIDANELQRKVTFEVDGEKIEVDLQKALDDKKVDIGNGSITEKEVIRDAINSANNSSGNPAGLTASIEENGKLKIVADGEKEIRVTSDSTNLGLSTMGLYENTKSNADGELFSAVDPEAKATVDISLNGIKKTITLDGTKPDLGLEESLNKAFGKDAIRVTTDGTGKLTFKASDKGQQITVGGTRAGLAAIGMEDGQSDKIATGLKLKDIAFGKNLQGDRYKFTINGADFSFTGEDTLANVMSKINGGKSDNGVDPNVKVTYNNMEDKFNIESASTGKGFDITISQTEGNLLNAMFGDAIKGGTTITSPKVNTENMFAPNGSASAFSGKGGYMLFEVDGAEYQFNIPEKIKKDVDGNPETEADGTPKYEDYTKDELLKFVNGKFMDNFGYTDDGKKAIQIVESGGKMNLEVNNGATVKVTGTATPTDPNTPLTKTNINIFEKLGFSTSQTNMANEETTLEELGITGNTTKLKDLDGFKNGSFAIKDGKITATKDGILTGADLTTDAALGSELMTKWFGSDSITLGGQSGTLDVKKGQNAIVNINGVGTERTSNTFSVGGLQFELKEVTGDYTFVDGSGNLLENGEFKLKDGKVDPNIATVDTTRDTKQIFDGIKSFVDEYNKLVKQLTEITGQKTEYKDYPPLTDAQKKDMSDGEIVAWEKKAQIGLLRNDNDVSTFMQNMRSVLYTRPEGSSIALFDIGIETSSDWKENGQLKIKDDVLKQMIEADPKAIEDLFKGGTDGIMKQLNDTINAAAKTSMGSPGTLVILAGVDGLGTDKSNTITDRINKIDDKIKTLKNTYTLQKNRYWKQFNAMEKMVQNMNSQSSWIAQQFA